jgi:tryptophanyl-tRNA synthetase
VNLNLAEGTFEEIGIMHGSLDRRSRNTLTYSALGFLADNSTIYYQSEATGYSHLYTHNLNKKNSS